LKRELHLLFTAIMFYTRIPVPRWVDHDANNLNAATRYFPLVGYIVAIVSWLTYIVCWHLFSVEISVIMSVLAGVLLTGAFHEDGLADVCDGFGGGWTKEKILSIMKDSRVGTYGVIGLIFILSLKFFSLVQLGSSIYSLYFGLVLLVAHSLSRVAAVFIIYTSIYAREDADSKAKPVAQQLSIGNLLLASIWAILPIAALVYLNAIFLLIVVPVMCITLYLRWYFRKWIGGYTGDCLGATQQLSEVIIYLSLLAIWRFM
jgi:adenosylcobinamide-GDP ribazoletransferase